MKHASLLLLMSTLALGCQKKEGASAPASSAPPATSGALAAQASPLTPPAPRLATPLALKSLGTPSAGTLTLQTPQGPRTHDVRAVALQPCRSGWIFQAFYLNEHQKPAVTQPAVFMERELVTGERISVPHPSNHDLTTTYEIAQYDEHHVRGTLSFATASGEPRLTATFDAPNISPAPAQGLGTWGCFTTGSYELTRESGERALGPITARRDVHDSYKLHLELSPTHSFSVWVHLPVRALRVGEVVDVELEDVLTTPRDHRARAFFEVRSRQGLLPAQQGTAPTLWTRTPAPRGRLQVELLSVDERDMGAMITLTGLVVPGDWEGPLAGERVDIRGIARFVTDRRGMIVPIAPRLPPRQDSR